MGGFRIRESAVRELIAGRTPAGFPTSGVLTRFEVQTPGGLAVELEYVRWEGGEREIRRAHGRGDRVGHPPLEIEDWGDGWLTMELGTLRRDEQGRVTAWPASEYELDAAAHACVRCALQVAGATAMGSRQEVLGVGDDRRHHLCTIFPEDARLVPAVVFALTRLAPLLHLDRMERV